MKSKWRLPKYHLLRRLFKAAIDVILPMAAISAHAVSIVSTPNFLPATKAPLAGTLKVDTDVDSRVSVSVTDGTETWQRNFFDYSTNHSEVLLGFKPGRTYVIEVSVYDKYRNSVTVPKPLNFTTAPLPANFPVHTVLKSDPNRMEPGYTMFIVQRGFWENTFVTIVDNTGEVVWYMPSPSNYDLDVRQLPNGDLFFPEQAPEVNDFIEVNMLGETVRTLTPPPGYPVNAHDGIPTDRGTILYVTDTSRQIDNFPSSTTDPNAPLETATVDDNPIVEISEKDGTLIDSWSPMDLLDPKRINYSCFLANNSFGVDFEHANALLDIPGDSSIIASLRNQDAVFKFSRTTGQIKWILGPHENWGPAWQPYLLTPVGSSFTWNYGQHAPELTPQGTLLVYDDGNFRAEPYDTKLADANNYSRGVEFSIDETNMTVTQVWDSSLATNEDRLFTPILGCTRQLPQTQNILVTYGYVTYVNGAAPSQYNTNAPMVRIVQYTHDAIPQVMFDLSFFDYNNTSPGYTGVACYRANWISDLYPHQALPVTELTVQQADPVPVLTFSADPTHGYDVEASDDLKTWTDIGPASEDGSTGDFSFLDLSGPYPERYYRVVTN